MTNNLIDRTRAHLQRCALCSTFESCDTFALLHAEGQFNQRVRFRLWIDGHEVLFIPVCDAAWHARYVFSTGKGHFMTEHYIGNPAGSIKTFKRAITYARACLHSANEDLIDHMQGCCSSVVRSGPAL